MTSFRLDNDIIDWMDDGGERVLFVKVRVTY